MVAEVLSLCSPVCPTLYHNLIRNHVHLTQQKAMKDEKIESCLANETWNTCYVFHCSPVVKHRPSFFKQTAIA